jgi:hypothetical protein
MENKIRPQMAVEGKEYHASAFMLFGSKVKGAGDIHVTVSHVSEPANIRDKRVVHFRLSRKTPHVVPAVFSMLESDFLTEFEAV